MNVRRRVVLLTGLMSCAVLCPRVEAKPDVQAGAIKAAVCAGCHGPAGTSVNPMWPNLAGQHAAYLEKQIKAFRDRTRIDPTMQPFVAALSDRDVADIAAFFASRKACR